MTDILDWLHMAVELPMWGLVLICTVATVFGVWGLLSLRTAQRLRKVVGSDKDLLDVAQMIWTRYLKARSEVRVLWEALEKSEQKRKEKR